MKLTGVDLSIYNENRILEARIKELATELDIYKYDELTGFSLRRDFLISLTKVIDTDEKRYLTLFNINKLSHVNRIEGYDAGDVLIKKTATDIKNLIPNSEYYRVSSNEFMIISHYKPNKTKVFNTVSAVVNLKDYNNINSVLNDIYAILSDNKVKYFKEFKVRDRRSNRD